MRGMLRLLALTGLLVELAGAAAAVEPDGVAVIVGNKTYQGRIPAVEYAHNDAEAIRRYVIDVLGFDRDNIIDLRDATQAQMQATFGNRETHKGKLWRYLDPKGGSDIVVFYSGHGVPGQNDKRRYLLPTDADPDQAEINGYPVDLLYRNLDKLKARSKTVLLDACFSGDSPKGMLIRLASPVFIQAKAPKVAENMTVLTAASGSQLASWDETARHGLFTEHLLRGLYGEADKDKNGAVSLGEVKAFLDTSMTRAARRTFGREQSATAIGKTARVLSTFAPGRPPTRPRTAGLRAAAGASVPQPAAAPVAQATPQETVFWQSVQDSQRAEEFEAYLKAYPSGIFGPLARSRLENLKARKSAAVAPTSRDNTQAVSLADFSGTWETTYGRMVLSQQGNHVTGGYEYNGGKIAGNVVGNKLRGQWRETALIFCGSGDMEFVMSQDGRSFSGGWRGLGSSNWTNWTGSRP